MVERAYKAALTDSGQRHPVTRDLPGSEASPPAWGDWLRLIGAEVRPGVTPILAGADKLPLLALSREEKGRVALLLSDHAWLWARGYEGGGPHLDLLRRLGHWLMKEPALEEEALRANTTGHGREVRVERQTMADTAEPVTVTAPSGKTRTLTLNPDKPGLFAAAFEADELGLHTLRSGPLVAFVSVGPANPRELVDVFSDTERLRSLAEATGGSVRRLAEAGAGSPSRGSRSPAPAGSPARTGSASARATARWCGASRSTRSGSAWRPWRRSPRRCWRCGWWRGGAGGRERPVACRDSRHTLRVIPGPRKRSPE